MTFVVTPCNEIRKDFKHLTEQLIDKHISTTSNNLPGRLATI